MYEYATNWRQQIFEREITDKGAFSTANYNKANPFKRIAGVALTQALMGLLPNTKFGKFMGLGEEEQVASSTIEEAPRPVVVPQEENFSVEPVFEAV